MAFGEIPRGLDDLAAYPLVAGVPGTKVDIPGAQGLEWTVDSDSDELRGDNQVIALTRNPKSLSGTITIAKLNLTGLATLTGGTTTTSGVTPNQIISLEETSAAPANYIQVVGQADSKDTNGSAYRVTLYSILVTGGPDETMTIDDWSTPSLDFEGIANGSGMLLKRQNYETAVPIA